MATQNATITTAWLKIADAADDPVSIQAANPASDDLATEQGHIQYQLAAMDAESAPTGIGLTVYTHEQVATRTVLGEGHIYARLTYSSADASSAVIVVTGSSETLS